MRDEETGTWWQQVSGEAIVGPLKGQRLRSVLHDEITFKMWKQEQPRGRVLKPDPTVDAKNYVPADWDTRMEKVPVRIAQDLDPKLSPRTLVVGVVAGNVAKAYPSEVVAKQSPIVDELGGVPLLIVAGNDRKSVRGFERVIDGRVLEFFKKKDSSPLVLVDSQTGSEWDFTGKAISGPLTGKQIKQIFVLNDYWFDWKNYHPKTSVYDAGL